MGIRDTEVKVKKSSIDNALLIPQPWDDVDSLYNWRVCVGERTRAIWDTFTDEQKLAIAGDADVTFWLQEAIDNELY